MVVAYSIGVTELFNYIAHATAWSTVKPPLSTTGLLLFCYGEIFTLNSDNETRNTLKQSRTLTDYRFVDNHHIDYSMCSITHPHVCRCRSSQPSDRPTPRPREGTPTSGRTKRLHNLNNFTC